MVRLKKGSSMPTKDAHATLTAVASSQLSRARQVAARAIAAACLPAPTPGVRG